MKVDLVALSKRQGIRRNIALRPISASAAQGADLARIIAPAWKLWQDRRDRIIADYERRPFGDGLTRDDIAQLQSAIDEVTGEFMALLRLTIAPNLKRWAARVENIHRDKWAAAVKAGTGIDLGMILSPGDAEETLDAFLARMAALVRDISDQARGRISDAVFRGYQQRTPVREVAKSISEATGLARKRAVRIAADQNTKLSAALDRARMQQAGIDQYRWVHSGKAHPREEHLARDGEVSKIGQPAGDMPGELPFCGCQAQAWLPILDEMKI